MCYGKLNHSSNFKCLHVEKRFDCDSYVSCTSFALEAGCKNKRKYLKEIYFFAKKRTNKIRGNSTILHKEMRKD